MMLPIGENSDLGLREHIEHLKSALLSLPATGKTGFEGLVGEALREITGVPFRLARSGSQYGIDGRATFEADAISFECKLYSNGLGKDEVLARISEASINDPDMDIWVLGATTQLPTQLADLVRRRGEQDAISVLILDWATTGLPLLAVALAMGGTTVLGFLKSHMEGVQFHQAEAALDAVRTSPDFSSHADRIRAECDAPSVGLALARRANTAWLSDVFSSRKQAKLQFGQPLAPGDKDNVTIRQRKALIDQLNSHITDAPDNTVVYVLGGEGCGKSWIVAQSWLNLARKPLMLFLTPIDFPDTNRRLDVDELLIKNLIRQTGERDCSPTIQGRWRRMLGQWRNCPATDGPRLIVVIDGINQRPKLDWPRIIMRVADEIGQLGGRVIITAHTPHFKDRVRPRFTEPFVEIPVPEWTELERDTILSECDVTGSALRPHVAAILRNPRLLGITLELLKKGEVTSLEELSLPLLLFEHMRMSERDAPQPESASEIAHNLQDYAQKVLSRVKDGQEDVLSVVNDIQAVADGRFFQTVDGDATLITLKEEGLTLALGFYVISRLLSAQRSNSDLANRLNVILEPMAALTITSDVVLAALTIAVVNDRFATNEIIVALIEGFASLQNPDQASFSALAGLAKRRPNSFMDAAQALCLSERYQPNFDWIQEAPIAASRDAHCWPLMVGKIHSWLSVYSLSPERGILRLPTPDQQQKVQDQIEKNRLKLEQKKQALSASELKMLEAMSEEKGDLSRLSQLALQLLAGKPLASFAQSLVKFPFSSALNSDHATPYKEFRHLVSLNRIDWAQTRKALLSESALLRNADVSSTGKWALVTILRATGHSDDGEEADTLVEDLTKGRPRPTGWRRIETYCASDPCDPDSEKPENVAHTVEQYGEIDVSKVSIAMGPTSEGLFFAMARPGIARFVPEVAAAKHRELFADVLHRTGFPLRQGLFELSKHTALLTEEDARAFLKRRSELSTNHATDGLSKEDAWIVSQYHLLLAFPFLSAQEQAATLLAGEQDERFLLDLFHMAKSLDEKVFESLLRTACAENDERGQSLLLQLGYHTSAPLSVDARKRVAKLMQSVSDEVRTFALGVIAQSGDKELLGEVVKSEWTATGAKTKSYFETWFGSMVLLEAASQGLIAHEDAVDRISARLYGRAAAILDTDAVHEIARRVDVSIAHVVGLGNEIVAPDIELQVDPARPCEPSRFTVNERPSQGKDLAEQMRLLSEDAKAFEQRQRNSRDAFLKLEANLTRASARIILDNLSLEGFAAVVTAAGELADRWHKLFMNIADNKVPSVHNLILWLAHALARKDSEKAKMLLRKAENCEPFVRITYGRARIHLDAMATWSGIRNPVLDDLRFALLDRAHTDHDLSLEVLAALLNDQQELLVAYVEAKLDKQEPSEVARGVMVAGFSDQSEFNDEVLASYGGEAGLIGDALKAAKYAYERNVWARHWFEMMCQTDDREDFWRHSVLFSKIVDGRFDAWRTDYAQKGNPIQLFGFSLDEAVKKRIARWKTHRSKTLFGLDAPAPVFLQSSGSDFHS